MQRCWHFALVLAAAICGSGAHRIAVDLATPLQVPAASHADSLAEQQANQSADFIPGSGARPWQSHVEEAKQRALSYINSAIAKFQAGDTEQQLQDWFGASRTKKKTIGKVLDTISSNLKRAFFTMGASKCGDQWNAKSSGLGYVYPKGKKCKNNELKRERCLTNHMGFPMFHICEPFMRALHYDQDFMLLKEASQMPPAFRKEQCATGYSGYGQACKRPALGQTKCRTLATDWPSKALKNPSNYAYYIMDVVQR